MEARSWSIRIPIRPKAVQSVRGGSHGFYSDPRVRKWKDAIRPFIRAASPGRPSSLPLQITRLRYIFKCPKSMPKFVREYIAAGGIVPYIGTADITDNLSKGLIDTCAGIVFVNDNQIWRSCCTEKVYGPEDGMELAFEETPDVLMADGSYGSGDRPGGDSLL